MEEDLTELGGRYEGIKDKKVNHWFFSNCEIMEGKDSGDSLG